jgi:hypothetical protein
MFGQMQIILVARALGLGAAGVLRAMQMPALVMSQITVATGPLSFPACPAILVPDRWLGCAGRLS